MSKYKLVNPPNVGSMIAIKPIGKGSVPEELRGMYTTRQMAQRAIDDYEALLVISQKAIEVAKEAVKLIRAEKKAKATKE